MAGNGLLCMATPVCLAMILVAACQAAQASSAGDLLSHAVTGRGLHFIRFGGSLSYGSSKGEVLMCRVTQ